MSREVIQDFLNSAGVVGISLTTRRMRPYFYGLDAVLARTKQALGQGVLQVIENVPEGFESFEFNFAGHIVFIYKLTHGLVLLVLTDSDLKLVDYSLGITKIKHLIETDTYNTVAHFKLLLGSITQHSLPSSSNVKTDPNSNKPIATNNPTQITSPTKLVSAKTDPQEYKLDELLVALNKLSQFTTQYLGKVVVTNYWKSSRPTSAWLAEFEIDRSGQISHPKQASITCDPKQIQQIQSWVSDYVKRCKKVIRNFDQMLEKDCLDSRQRQILL
jgi:hypothetical protein